MRLKKSNYFTIMWIFRQEGSIILPVINKYIRRNNRKFNDLIKEKRKYKGAVNNNGTY